MHQIRLKPRIRPARWPKVQKCLPCKPDLLSSIIRTNIKEPDVMAYLYNSTTPMARWEVKTGGAYSQSNIESRFKCVLIHFLKVSLVFKEDELFLNIATRLIIRF